MALDRARVLSDRLGDQTLAAHVLVTCADHAIHRGAFDLALAWVKQARSASAAPGLGSDVLARVSYARGDGDGTHAHAQEHLQAAEDSGDRAWGVRALLFASGGSRNPQHGLELASRAIEMGEAMFDEMPFVGGDVAEAKRFRALRRIQLGEFVEAIGDLTDAESFFAKFGWAEFQVRAIATLAKAQAGAGKPQEAIESAQRVLSSSFSAYHPEAHLTLGKVLTAKGAHAEAERHLQQMLQIAVEHGLSYAEALAHCQLGELFMAQSNLELSWASFEKALDCFSGLSMFHEERCLCLARAGLCAWKIGNSSTARDLFDNASLVADEQSLRPEGPARQAIIALGDLLKSGDNHGHP